VAGPSKKPTTSAGTGTSGGSSYEPKYLPYAIENKRPKYDSGEARRLANREWYKRNKKWKKSYNENYYRNNIDHFREYFKAKRQAAKDAQNRSRAAASNAKVMKGLRNGDEAYDVAQARLHKANVDAHDAKVELDAARSNLKLALKDYWWYVDQHKKMKVSEAWSDGFAQIRAAGKSFIDKFRSKKTG
jgi:hypothetical protein